jgi:DNA replication protein DnaC
MLTHPTLSQLDQLGLAGMAKAFEELQDNPEAKALDHAEWLGLLLDREVIQRKDRRLKTRLRAARLRFAQACVEDLDLTTARGLDRRLVAELSACNWIREHHNLILTGPCGTGKTWLACAFGQQAARSELTVLYHRIPRLFADLALAHGDGRYPRLFRGLCRTDLLILTCPSGLGDDFTCQVMKGAAGHPTIVAGDGGAMLKRPGDTLTETGGMASITTRAPDDIIVHGADTDSAA